MWCAPSRQQYLISATPLLVDNDSVLPVTSVRDLGIYLDSDASMKTHVSKTTSCCFNALRQIRSIRRSVSKLVLLSLATSLVLIRLDYGSTNLTGILSGRRLDRLQSVLNAAARLVCDGRKCDHISPLLRDLHWLPVPQRINCFVCLIVLVYRCRNNTAPEYLSRDLQWAADSDSRFFASCICSEPRTARFRLHRKFALRPHVQVWQTSNLIILTLGEEKKKEEETTG